MSEKLKNELVNERLRLPPKTVQELMKLRRSLHLTAELAGEESATSRLLDKFLIHCSPNQVIKGIGGHGLAAIFEGSEEGPTILLRADMDALPIPEIISLGGGEIENPVSHRCGHDGHMTILAGVASVLNKSRLKRGKVVLLFQPSEETGEGAEQILNDTAFNKAITPDYSFALHNLPGFKRGKIVVRDGVFAAASRGMIIELHGQTSHASEPEKGISPSLALAQIIQTINAAPQNFTGLVDAAQATVIHASVGEPEAFGTSPGNAVVMCTLRTYNDAVMEHLIEKCSSLATGIANAHGLIAEIRWTQNFPATHNNPTAVCAIVDAADKLSLTLVRPSSAFPWSEDFGHFTSRFQGAMFGLGAGEDHPNLHNPSYEFPDDIIHTGIAMFCTIIDVILKERLLCLKHPA